MSANAFTRRTLLGGVGGSVLLGSGLFAGCGSSSSSERNSGAANSAVQLPTYVPYTGVKPDLPGTEQGVDPAYRRFPTERPKSVPEVPGNGETIVGMANIYFAVPPGPERNSYWAGLNKRMNIDLKLQMVGNADYVQKYATTIAGNDLPDVMMAPQGLAPNFPQLLDKRFTNLSEYLSGDAIKEYPNLANVPTRTWRSAIFNGGIYGIPIPRGAIGAYHFIRQDLFEAAGVSPEPKGYDELIETGKALTDPKKRRWAYGTFGQPRALFAQMNGEPNIWREEGGKFTHTYETDEFKQTITDMTALWKSGVMHPDAFNLSQPFKALFNAGTVAINAADGYPGWNQYILDNTSTPGFKLGLMPNYTRDGSKLAQWNYGSGVFSVSTIAKQDNPDRVKLILRMLNYLAAPFGTEEYLYRLYGEEGVDHTKSADGDPVLTKNGVANTVIPIRYLADAPYAVYQPGRPQDADVQHAYQSKEIPTGIANPAIGLYSNTSATKGASAETDFRNGWFEVVQGRQPFSSLDDAIKKWRDQAGDGMRKEYEEQLQSAGKR